MQLKTRIKIERRQFGGKAKLKVESRKWKTKNMNQNIANKRD